MFANVPASNDPILSARLNEHAALIVLAQIASAGDIFICVQASESTIGIDGVDEVPGLKSLASTTARPASIIARARGLDPDPRAKAELCKITGYRCGDLDDVVPSWAV